MKNEIFIQKAILKHKDKYDYSKVEYIDSKNKVRILCVEHGEFLQTPNNHLSGQGCYKCKNNSQKSNLKTFIEKSIEKHGYRYDYSKSEYKNVRTDITIICKEHGEFRQKPNKHILGQGCNRCKIESNTLTNEDFIKKSIQKHGNKYNYSKSSYKYTNKKVIIICKEHGEFEQTPMTHISGSGCPKCGGTIKQNTNDFVNRAYSIYDNRYDYTLVNYENMHKKVIIICKEHGEFRQTPNSHLHNSGCPKCGDKFGIMENMWLDDLSISNRQVRISKYIVDGYDPITNTIYEFNGDFWHGNPSKYKKFDINPISCKTFGELYKKTLEKEDNLKKLGYNVISIWESDYLKEKAFY